MHTFYAWAAFSVEFPDPEILGEFQKQFTGLKTPIIPTLNGWALASQNLYFDDTYGGKWAARFRNIQVFESSIS